MTTAIAHDPARIETFWTDLLASHPGPTGWQLADIAVKVEDLRDRAVARLIDSTLGDRLASLYRLMRELPSHRARVWEAIKSSGDYDDHQNLSHLRTVLKECPEQRAEVWEVLKDRDAAALVVAIQHLPELRDEAWTLRKRRVHGRYGDSVIPLLPHLSQAQQEEAWLHIQVSWDRCASKHDDMIAVFWVSDVLREQAWQLIVAYLFRRSHLQAIFLRSESYRERAWEKILEPGKNSHDVEETLFQIIKSENCPPDLQQRALAELLRRDPWGIPRLNDNGRKDQPFLEMLIWDLPTLRLEIWPHFRTRASVDQLNTLIATDELRELVFEELLSRDLVAAAFLSQALMIRLRERAIAAALSRNPTPADLMTIFRWSEGRRAEVTRLLPDTPENRPHLLTIIHYQPVDPAAAAIAGKRLLAMPDEITPETLDIIERHVPALAEAIVRRRRAKTKDVLDAFFGT